MKWVVLFYSTQIVEPITFIIIKIDIYTRWIFSPSILYINKYMANRNTLIRIRGNKWIYKLCIFSFRNKKKINYVCNIPLCLL